MKRNTVQKRLLGLESSRLILKTSHPRMMMIQLQRRRTGYLSYYPIGVQLLFCQKTKINIFLSLVWFQDSIKLLVCGCSLKHQNLNLYGCSFFMWSLCYFSDFYISFYFSYVSEPIRAEWWDLFFVWASSFVGMGSKFGFKLIMASIKIADVKSFSWLLISGNLLVPDSAPNLKTPKFINGCTNKKQR
jgi:hypothetical protein